MATFSEYQQAEATDVNQELEQTIGQALKQAEQHQLKGEIKEAEKLYLGILEVLPNHPGANHNFGVLLEQKQAGSGLHLLQNALKENPECEHYWLSYISALIQSDQIDSASQMLELGRRHGLEGEAVDELAGCLQAKKQSSALKKPQLSVLPGNKGTLERGKGPSSQELKKLDRLQRNGKTAAVKSFAKDLTVRYPNHGLGWKILGGLLERQERIDEALPPMQKAVELMPEDTEAFNTMGVLLQKKVRLDEAEKFFLRSLELKPENPHALSNLGNLYRTQGRLAESEKCFHRALAIEANAAIYNNLGANLLDQKRIVEAEDCYRRALKIQPDSALAHINLGVCLRYQGRLDEAIASQRRALKLEPDCAEKNSNFLFTLNYTSALAKSSHLDEAKKFGRMVKRKVKNPFSEWRCESSPERLKIGFVSGDLYNHPVGFFLESLLGEFDRKRVELIAYPTNPKADELTARIKPCFAAWKPLFGLSDEAAAHMIHEDGVHILMDLSGHTSYNRLPMFVWKPAPVQVSWLGYFATTGVSEIDYFIADKAGVPEEQKNNFTETVWYLPETRLCFSAPGFDLPVAPLPALAKGHITFGCFQKLTKVGDDVLKVWSAVLNELPHARLRWQCAQFDDPAVVEQVKKRLQRAGIDPDRVTFKGSMSRPKYLEAHAEVDLILDTFPYPGGTTTCEALWMGVPTLTLAGGTLLSRQGASLLSAAGLEDWIATGEADYVAKAAAKAKDLQQLATLRTRLRPQVLSSPLFDAQRFVGNFEEALWEMWRKNEPRVKAPAPVYRNGKKEETMNQDQVMNFFSPVFWGTKDPEKFTSLMRQAADQTNAYHFGDNMFLFQRNNSMLNDQDFMKSWEGNAITSSDRAIIWRRFILTMAGFHCQHLAGDFVECGAYQGVGAKTVIDYLGGKNFQKTFWLYDLFEHSEDMIHHSMQHHGPQLYDQVVARFKGYPNVKIFKGELPAVLEQGSPEKIAYLHIDLNQAPAEISTLDSLFNRVVPGGMIILDDYEMVFYRAQKLAEDSWFATRGYKVFPLPTSQGFVIKR